MSSSRSTLRRTKLRPFKASDLRPRLTALADVPVQKVTSRQKFPRPVIHNTCYYKPVKIAESRDYATVPAQATPDERHQQHRAQLARKSSMRSTGWPYRRIKWRGQSAAFDLPKPSTQAIDFLERAAVASTPCSGISSKKSHRELSTMRTEWAANVTYGHQYVSRRWLELIQFPIEDPSGLEGGGDLPIYRPFGNKRASSGRARQKRQTGLAAWHSHRRSSSPRRA